MPTSDTLSTTCRCGLVTTTCRCGLVTSSRFHHSQLLPGLVAHQARFTLRLRPLQWPGGGRLSFSCNLPHSVICLSCCDRCFLQARQPQALLL